MSDWILDSFLGFLLVMLGVFALIMAIIFVGVVYGGRAYGRGVCSKWGAQTGIRTKFTVIGWADSGTCLARTRDGRWVQNTRVFINVPERKP